MDKFTKTTEVDISSMNVMEEDTPKKSKAGKIVAIILSFLLATIIWLYVVETDTTKYEEIYDDVKVEIVNEGKFLIIAENVSVAVTGTKSALVDLEKTDIIVELDADQVTSTGEHTVKIEVRIDDDMTVEAKIVGSDMVKVQATEKK